MNFCCVASRVRSNIILLHFSLFYHLVVVVDSDACQLLLLAVLHVTPEVVVGLAEPGVLEAGLHIMLSSENNFFFSIAVVFVVDL